MISHNQTNLSREALGNVDTLLDLVELLKIGVSLYKTTYSER
jgi:hypothetical protein